MLQQSRRALETADELVQVPQRRVRRLDGRRAVTTRSASVFSRPVVAAAVVRPQAPAGHMPRRRLHGRHCYSVDESPFAAGYRSELLICGISQHSVRRRVPLTTV